MGSQSFKCPSCHKWFLCKRAIKQHINDKHHIHNFFLDGVGPFTKIKPNLSRTREANWHYPPDSGSPQGKQ